MINSYRVISNSEVADYISDELFERLKNDSIKSLSDVIDGGLHLGFYSDDRIVGVFSIGVFDEYAMLHPKINKAHMLHAKRACDLALGYVEIAGFKAAFAKIPSNKKANIRMAESCGMILADTLKDHIAVNGNDYDVNIYKRVF